MNDSEAMKLDKITKEKRGGGKEKKTMTEPKGKLTFHSFI